MRLLGRSLPKGAGKRLLLLLFLTPLYLLAQSQEVSGTVKDSTGRPLAGVSVSVKGKNLVTITKSGGTFIIPAQTGDVLVFSGVSLENQEILIGSKTTLDVTMQTSAYMMTDVVVVGYGKGSRKTLSSAITSVKPEDLNRGAIGDVGQLLQGKVPGLNITANGDPNRPAAIILRGASTINSPQGPFYVIDGIPGADINTVAPDDIASIDVLKDASATAIYGNRASNGVIMVTTKRGKKGALQATYNGYVGIESVTNGLDLMDTTQLREYVRKNNSSINPNDDKGASTDWMKAIQKDNAFSHNHNISFSGGTDKSTYSASLNYLKKDGIILQSSLERVIARISAEHRALNDHLIFGLNLMSSNSKASNVPFQNMVFQQAVKYNPTSPVYNADGTFFENLNNTGYFNPVSIIKNAKDDTKYGSLQGAFTVEAKLPFGFTYNMNLAYQRGTWLHGEYYSKYYSQYYNSSNFYTNGDPGGGRSLRNFYSSGLAYRGYYQGTTKTLESYLTWAKRLGLHNIKAVVGYSWQKNTSGDGLQNSQTNFISDYTSYNNMSLGNYQTVNGFVVDFGGTLYQETNFISDFARLNYDFNEKYLLQASVRRDGSSVFGKNKEWGYFPSVGAAWRISQEDFLRHNEIISELKLRASYGETGNAFGLGAYTSQQLYDKAGSYYNAGVFATSIRVSQGYNPDLQWEKTSTKNIGIDYGILDGRISGSIDVYEKLTTGMIFPYAVSPTIDPSGFVYMNVGKIRNRGIEFSLNVSAVNTKDFSWNTALNLASNKNEILSLKGPEKYGMNADSTYYTQLDGPGTTGSTLQMLAVGNPLGLFYSFKYAGKDASGNSLFITGKGDQTSNPTQRVDYHPLGSPHPKLMFGWVNNFRYKNFDLNLFIRGVTGNKIFNGTRADLHYVTSAGVTNITPDAMDDAKSDARNNNYSSRFVEDGSYIRLDNATLGYRFKLNSPYIKQLRFYTTINNAFVITKYKGIDPEINQGGASLGVDYNNFYPRTRTILFGVSVGF
ncbi:SusC/RagA family TonB-linked outer membrane protein [Niastella populi]|uniref:SusC/RagA family TonB-linked outer membrane protein n=1 Tax=Niastella populi TaxID=550983 RepID=A0A1V9F5X3_9BACT|nr:SusC/RagA family TonB-linked outer membrane protein [Niastella populi]OQP53672.1 SusC/RagA family TonB-linked outer membrane protein [Niastella populi]